MEPVGTFVFAAQPLGHPAPSVSPFSAALSTTLPTYVPINAQYSTDSTTQSRARARPGGSRKFLPKALPINTNSLFLATWSELDGLTKVPGL